MTVSLRSLAAMAIVVLPAVVAAPAARAQEPAGKPLFTDVTKESGVADVMAKHRAVMHDYLAKIGNPEYTEWWFSGPTLVDLDGNGTLDLHLAGHKQYGTLAYNDGKGHFTTVDGKFDIPRAVQPQYARNSPNRNDKPAGPFGDIPFPGGEIRLAYDFSGNGKLDLLVSWDDGFGRAYLNDSTPAPGTPFTGTPALPGGPLGPGTPIFNFKPHDFGFDAFSRGACIVDINRDGFVDYLTTGDQGSRREFNTLDIALGKGDGKFVPGPKITVPKESGAIPIDINGDGLMDLLCSQRGYAATGPQTRRWILLNNPNAAETQPSSAGVAFTRALDTGLSESGTIHGVGDVNQDGYPDLIGIDDEGGGKLTLALYINDGKGHFTRQVLPVTPTKNWPAANVPEGPHYTNWGGAIVCDFDNDGIADIGVNGRNFMYIFRGLGGGKFEQVNDQWGVPAFCVPSVDDGLCFGDIDGDGALDFITCTPRLRRDVTVWHNNTTGTPGRHWLNIQLIGKKGNAGAAGSTIRLLDPQTGKLLWYEQVSVWSRQQFHSYYDARHTERHFGLGPRATADVEVTFYPSGKKVMQKGVAADKTVEVREE